MKHIEDSHQERLFIWARTKGFVLPGRGLVKLIDYMYAIPNGGKRGKLEAARLKKQGVKAGVSDIHLTLPYNGLNGLWIELKRPIVKGKSKPTVTKTQKEWIKRMNENGHRAVVAYGYKEARAAIESYFTTD